MSSHDDVSSHNDEFDLDVRFSWTSDAGPDTFHPGLFAADTVAPEATCPANTCGLDCQTQTCPDATCGCNTSETCANPMCGSDAITFGRYCEDQSDDTCDACGGGGTGAACIDDDAAETQNRCP
jgi:hypothetical protein